MKRSVLTEGRSVPSFPPSTAHAAPARSLFSPTPGGVSSPARSGSTTPVAVSGRDLKPDDLRPSVIHPSFDLKQEIEGGEWNG